MKLLCLEGKPDMTLEFIHKLLAVLGIFRVYIRVFLPITFIWQNSSLRKNSSQGHCKSLSGQGLAQLIALASYLSDFTHKITECSKQELTSCVISLIPNFLA